MAPKFQWPDAGNAQEQALKRKPSASVSELTQSGSSVSGFWTIGNDEVPIREGKIQDNRIELITFADDKLFTSVARLKAMK